MQKTTTSPEQIRDRLEEDLVNGALPPGSKLDEASLCRQFKVSRTPVREALRQLATSGLIQLIPNRGAFVAEMSLAKLIEMFEVMAELEGMCGRLAARRITEIQKQRLREHHDECRSAGIEGNTDTYYYANAEFHEVIYEACGNSFLIEQVRMLQPRLQPYRRMQLRVPKRVNDSFAEHQEIVDAIDSGDEAAAESALRAHLLIQGEKFNDFVAAMESNPSLMPTPAAGLTTVVVR